MNVGAPTALASYAYQVAGGGSSGVLAALDVLKGAGLDAAGLVQSAGGVPGTDVLNASQGTGLEAGTYDLQAAAGQGAQDLQNLLNPPLGYANPFLGAQSTLSPQAALAYAAYQYGQAQAAGQGDAYAQAALGSAAPTFPADLYASAAPTPSAVPNLSAARYSPLDTNRDGLISPTEELAYAVRNPGLSLQDANLDGLVSPAESLAYGLQHPGLDPADTNFDGFVSGAEALAYALAHPTLGTAQRASGSLDVFV